MLMDMHIIYAYVAIVLKELRLWVLSFLPTTSHCTTVCWVFGFECFQQLKHLQDGQQGRHC